MVPLSLLAMLFVMRQVRRMTESARRVTQRTADAELDDRLADVERQIEQRLAELRQPGTPR